jgi:hypothetical protein
MYQIFPHDISYLLYGNETQKKAYHTLNLLNIMKHLKKYHPTLTGTIPIRLNIQNSDLDIICEVKDFKLFEKILTKHFGHHKGFVVNRYDINQIPSLVSNFDYNQFPIEVFAQPIKVTEQNAYRHLIAEYNLLTIGGEPARKRIISLKENGMKTEPAFALYFGIDGDPYHMLRELSYMNPEELTDYLESLKLD